MAKLTFILQNTANDHPKSLEALAFAQAAIAQQHEICCVFFYREAVDHAQAQTPAENKALIGQWEQFSHQYQVPLVACQTVAERKGIEVFHPSFEASGLTALSTSITQSDRTLQF